MIELACLFDLGLICGPLLGLGVILCGIFGVKFPAAEHSHDHEGHA